MHRTADPLSKEHHTRPPLPDTLDGVLSEVWELLVRGAQDRRHGFHLPTLATVSADGSPDVRTVVLRRADPAEGLIVCHTDARSAKASQLARSDRVAWCFYDTSKTVQVRAWGRARLERPADSASASRVWEQAPVGSRRCYLAPQAPSTPAAEPIPNLPDDALDGKLTPAQVEPGRANFAVLTTTVDRIDWLSLRASGHRRAAFDRHGSGWNPTWLAP